MSEPKLEQVGFTASVGGKVQIIQYKLSSDYFVSASRTYSIPEDWDNSQAEDFQVEQMLRLRDLVDSAGQAEFEALHEQSDWRGEEF